MLAFRSSLFSLSRFLVLGLALFLISANSVLAEEKKEEPKTEPAKEEVPFLLPRDKMEKWPYLDNFLFPDDEEKITQALEMFDKEPEKVPPYGYFMAAEQLLKRGENEKASLIYYVGQLRARFDGIRWAGAKTEDDQYAAAVLYYISRDIGTRINLWAMETTDRLKDILIKTKEWDEKTPYHYRPYYPDMPEAVPEEKWQETLDTVRQQYFRDAQGYLDALRKMGR